MSTTMFLRKYSDSDFPALQSWVTDPDLLFTFAGGSWSYPLSFEQVKAYQEANPLKQSYVLCSEQGTAIAFGELITGEANSPRLGRLLVGAKENRGKGIGKILIHKLIEECRKNYDQRFIHLFVFEDNFMAIRCYENMGFTFVPEVVVPMASPQGHAASALLMTRTFDD